MDVCVVVVVVDFVVFVEVDQFEWLVFVGYVVFQCVVLWIVEIGWFGVWVELVVVVVGLGDQVVEFGWQFVGVQLVVFDFVGYGLYLGFGDVGFVVVGVVENVIVDQGEYCVDQYDDDDDFQQVYV